MAITDKSGLPPELRYYSLTELEKVLVVTHRTLLDYCNSGKLKAVKVGNRWRVSEESLKDFLGQNDENHGAEQIFLNEKKRLQLGSHELACGDALQVLIVSPEARSGSSWVETTVEHDGSGYYLTGLSNYNAVGLFGRI